MMFRLLVRLMLAAALIELGMKETDFEGCRSRQCLRVIQRKALEVLKIEWRPIRVWPEDGRRLK